MKPVWKEDGGLQAPRQAATEHLQRTAMLPFEAVQGKQQNKQSNKQVLNGRHSTTAPLQHHRRHWDRLLGWLDWLGHDIAGVSRCGG